MQPDTLGPIGDWIRQFDCSSVKGLARYISMYMSCICIGIEGPNKLSNGDTYEVRVCTCVITYTENLEIHAALNLCSFSLKMTPRISNVI